jgi:hypothetical protein
VREQRIWKLHLSIFGNLCQQTPGFYGAEENVYTESKNKSLQQLNIPAKGIPSTTKSRIVVVF